MREWTTAGLLGLALFVSTLGTAPLALGQEVPEVPEDEDDLLELAAETADLVAPDHAEDPVATATDDLNPTCDPLDPALCLFPFPSNQWTTADATTPTGLRVDIPITAMPRNVAGKPVDPTEFNRNDGFSPGSMFLTLVPDLDLVATWGLGDLPERYRDQVTDLALSLHEDAPIVLVDADTGQRHPFFSELDGHEDTPEDARTLIVRPAVNLREGHRYVIGLRDLVDSAGTEIAAGAAFAALRDGTAGGARQAHYDDTVFPVLADAGVDRDELVLAWDATVASGDNLAGRVLAMRDQAFAMLGDTDLADSVVQGDAPVFTVDEIEERGEGDDTLRRVHGTITVPNFLTHAEEVAVDVPDVGSFEAPQARLYYGTPLPGPMDVPTVNPVDPTRVVPFTCSVPRTVLDGTPAIPTLYGHGLLGSRGESTGSSTERMREAGYMPCAVDWLGMATGDIPNVAMILADVSFFASLADRAQQGFVNFLYLGRALSHPDGLASDPAFQQDGDPIIDVDGLVYDGNSQGGIMGGALTALAPDFTRAVLGVPATNYSTLLNRSVDWEGAYAEANYAAYPNKITQQAGFALLQMLWDRAEGNGFAQHMTDDPYPNTPEHQVLLHVAFGDHQVANVAAEVEGRTIGARRIPTDLPACRHWALDQMFGFEVNDPTAQHPAVLAYYDSGTPTPPNDNTPPEGLGDDPHSDPRKDPNGIVQKVTFYETGRVVDPFDGQHAKTDRWPERAGDHLDEVLAQLDGTCLAATRDDDGDGGSGGRPDDPGNGNGGPPDDPGNGNGGPPDEPGPPDDPGAASEPVTIRHAAATADASTAAAPGAWPGVLVVPVLLAAAVTGRRGHRALRR